MMTSSTAAGSVPARLTASATTLVPRSTAERACNVPMNLPMGVLHADIMNASFMFIIIPKSVPRRRVPRAPAGRNGVELRAEPTDPQHRIPGLTI